MCSRWKMIRKNRPIFLDLSWSHSFLLDNSIHVNENFKIENPKMLNAICYLINLSALTREWSELVDNFLNEIRFTWKPVSWRVRRRVNFLLFRTHTILFIQFSKTIENAHQRVLSHLSFQCCPVSMTRGVLVTFLTRERNVDGSFPA